MTRSIEDVERELESLMAKFQPKPRRGFHVSGLTRTYLEYDDSGSFWEFDPVSGEVVETGTIGDFDERRVA